MSPSHFSRIFKAVVDQKPMEYLNAIKCRQAEGLLQNPELSIKEIAAQCGFCNQNHFSSWFKKHFQRPPSLHPARSGTDEKRIARMER